MLPSIPLPLLLLLLLLFLRQSDSISSPGSILITVNMFDFRNYESSLELFANYRDICEAGWSVKVVVLTAAHWTNDARNSLTRRMYCYHIDAPVPVEIRVYEQSEDRWIVMHSREPTIEFLDKFDLFLYIEDDMLFKYSHLVAWVKESNKLQLLQEGHEMWDTTYCSHLKPCEFSVGFLRTLHTKRTVDFKDPFNDAPFMNSMRLEERPSLEPICIANKPYMAVIDQPYQAFWLLSRQDIIHLNITCSFLNPPWGTSPPPKLIREYWASLQVYKNPWFKRRPTCCMLTKVIPAERLATFTVEHYQRSSKMSLYSNAVAESLRYGVDTVDELTRRGRAYLHPDKKIDLPACWNRTRDIYHAHRSS